MCLDMCICMRMDMCMCMRIDMRADVRYRHALGMLTGEGRMLQAHRRSISIFLASDMALSIHHAYTHVYAHVHCLYTCLDTCTPGVVVGAVYVAVLDEVPPEA